jgi:hypothetical protein
MYWNGRQGWFLDGTSPSRSTLGAEQGQGQANCQSFPFFGQQARFCRFPSSGG